MLSIRKFFVFLSIILITLCFYYSKNFKLDASSDTLILKNDHTYKYYEYYNDIHIVEQFIKENAEQLQCVVSKKELPLGHTQNPNLWDYADGADTVEFLRSL